MDKEKGEIRFLLKKEIYNELKDEAENCDVPLASYVKAHIKDWWKKIKSRRKKSGRKN